MAIIGLARARHAGQSDDMLAERERLNIDIQHVLDAQTDACGIKVANVEIKPIVVFPVPIDLLGK